MVQARKKEIKRRYVGEIVQVDSELRALVLDEN